MGDRRVALLLILLGAAISGLTVAVGEGLITGVRVAWPAHVLAGVLVVIGLVGLRRPRDDGRVPGPHEVPARRGDALPPIPPARGAWRPPLHDPSEFRGGGEPDGRD